MILLSLSTLTHTVVHWRGYCDHFVTMCVCVWLCMLAQLNENPWLQWLWTWHSSSPRHYVKAYWFWVQSRGSGAPSHHFELLAPAAI